MNKKVLYSLLVIVLALSAVFTTVQASGGDVTPTMEYKEGNPKCGDLNSNWFEIKFEDSNGWPTSITWGAVTISLEKNIADGKVISWSSNYGIDAVIVKGGPGANVYYYNPEAISGGNLYTPTNPNTNKPYGLSHVTFCFDLELEVKKTAEPYFTRTWDWTIDKSADPTELTLSPGQVFTVNYTVKVESSYTDSDWGVSGKVYVNNPAGIPVTFTLTDTLTDYGPVTLICPENYQNTDGTYTLPGSYTMECTYNVSLPDGTSRTNTATATPTAGKVGGGSAEVGVTFTNPTTKVDECVTVTDDRYGEFGRVCFENAPKTFTYTYSVGPYGACGEYHLVNTASFVTNDTETTGSASAMVKITVPCAGGCTLTPGYWKTHSSYGPAPYDSTWALLGEDTSFFQSGQTYYQVLWTPSAGGNAYYILARAYIAAKLNILNGADPAAVSAAMAWAETFFNTYKPSASLSKSVRADALSKASLLDRYNNGYIGPGHCSE